MHEFMTVMLPDELAPLLQLDSTSHLRCSHCTGRWPVPDPPQRVLIMPAHAGHIDDCLADYQDEQSVEHAICRECGVRGDMKKRIAVDQAAAVCCMYLRRTNKDGSRDDSWVLPLEELKIAGADYSLSSVIAHCGAGAADRGHYCAYVRQDWHAVATAVIIHVDMHTEACVHDNMMNVDACAPCGRRRGCASMTQTCMQCRRTPCGTAATTGAASPCCSMCASRS